MDISIGVFTAEPSMNNIKQATGRMEGGCTFTFLPYTSMHHLAALYKEQAHQFDGLLFSGLFPYQFILSHLGAPLKPHAYFEVTDRDYFRVLLRILYKNPGLDIRRIWIDHTLDISWGEVFDDAQAIPMYVFDAPWSYSLSGSDGYSVLLEKYLSLWRNQEVDFIITRVTNLAPQLQAEGIPFELLLPSPESMMETIAKLIYEIQTNRIVDALSAVGILQPAHELTLSQAAALQKQLGQFNRQQGMILVLRQNEQGYEIITSNSVLRDLTQMHSNCLLSDYLGQHCDIPFSLGWGVGVDIMQAQQNAHRALAESKRNRKHAPYLVTELDELVGPLIQGESISLATKPGADAHLLSKQLGISLSNMQKLLTIQRRRNNSRLSRNDLSLYLNVTLRTANRILTKLSEAGAAQVVATEQGATAGRPMALYELNLDKLLPPDFADE